MTFLIPVYDDTRRGRWELTAGLALYALLAGWTRLSRFARFSPRRLSPSLLATGLKTAGLKSVFRYWDAQTDDAMLTRAVLKSAQALGAQALCPAQMVSAERLERGYRLRISQPAGALELHCDYLINAGGPWVNEVLARVTPEASHRRIDRILGSHLVLEPALHDEAFYLESPIDQRAIFVLPWHGRTLLGTTERTFEGRPEDASVSSEDRDYLLANLHHYFPAYTPRIVSEFAGVRVLPHGDGRAFTRPRDCVFHWDDRHPHLLSLYGGKLTGYRNTGADVVAKVSQALGPREGKADTATLPLV